MSRAKDDLLDELHAATAEDMLSALRQYRAAGEPAPPALLNAIRGFLKDNGVDRAIQPGDPTDLLVDEAPMFEDVNIIKGKF